MKPCPYCKTRHAHLDTFDDRWVVYGALALVAVVVLAVALVVTR